MICCVATARCGVVELHLAAFAVIHNSAANVDS
jgi:hypothetical protein